MIDNGSLETARLLIRPFETGDIPDLIALFADPKVAQYVGDGGPLPEDEAILWVRKSRENLAHHGYGTGAIVKREGGPLIGWAGFARPETGGEEIIYGLAAEHWRQGFGTEILLGLLKFADTKGIAPVLATVDPDNHVSSQLLLKHGFEFVEHNHGGDPDSDLYRRDGVS
ncbi:MAG: GNAT family N-acetyltransferase [Erythrobacter sp.]